MYKDQFHKRSGTTDQGKDYENFLVAYYSLKLVLDDEVADFKISSNDEEHGNFDDLVIQTTWKNGRRDQFNIQAKHKQTGKNKNLLLAALQAEKGKFSVRKRFEEYIEKPSTDNAKLILFTNRKFDVGDNIELIRMQRFAVHIVHLKEHFEVINTAKEKQNSVYKFYVKESEDGKKDKAAVQEIKQYKEFFRHFYLYTNQKNANDVRDVITIIFQDKFKCDVNAVKNYLDFITTWCNSDGKKDILNKEFLQLKIVECLLSPYILVPTDSQNSERSVLFEEAIDRFDITVISNSNLLKNTNIAISKSQIDLNDLNQIGMKYQLLTKRIKNISEISDSKRAALLWLLNECPLILEVNDSNEAIIFKAISLCQCNSQKKKFILVGTKKKFLDWKTFHTLSDLYENCEDIYNKMVSTFTCSFQGQKEATLEDIINNNETLRLVFTTDELLTMVVGACNFGNPKEVVPDYYIERKLTKMVIDISFIDKFSDTNISVISCNGKLNYLKNKFQDVNFLQLDESSDSSDSPRDSLTEFFNKRNIYVAEAECPREMFKRICEENPTSPCHHFQIDHNNNLEWLESARSVESLRQSPSKENHFVKEKNLANAYQTNIICADAGMGKSMMMSNLKNNYSSEVWVVKILLREHVAFFGKSADHGEFLQYLLEISSLTGFEQGVFNKYKETKRVVLIWDGIDEIGREVFENVLKTIEEVKIRGFVQWITARTNLKRTLEERLNILSRSIKPFDEKDQHKYVLSRLHDVDNLEQTVDEIMKKIDNDHLGVPLQIFMLTELYRQNNRLCKTLLAYTFSVTDLYEYFVHEKFRFYYSKANIDVNNNVAKTIIQEHKERRIEDYEMVALNLCLAPEILATLKLYSIDNFLLKMQKEDDCFGILEVTKNTVNFAHRTYAEYFVALWLSKNYQKITNLGAFFFDDNFKGVRFMFDLIMAKECPAHVAVLYKNVDLLQKHLDEVNLQDKVGRSPLHLASSWGETHALLNSRNERKKIVIGTEKGFATKEENPNYVEILNVLVEKCNTGQKDRLFEFDCLQYADQSLSLSAINTFLKFKPCDWEQLKNFKDLPTILYYIIKFDYTHLLNSVKEVPYIETTTGGSLLHLCAAFDRPHILRLLLESKLYRRTINKTDQRKWAPVHYASCFGHLNIMKSLKNMGGDLHLGSRSGEDTPLYVAAQYEQIEVLQYLLSNKSNVNVSKKNGWTPLLVAVQKSFMAVIQLLVEHKADVNMPNKDGYGPLYVAARKGNLEVAKYLISKGAKVNMVGKNGEGPLYIAAKFGYLQVVKLLIHKQANVNAVKTNGWTPLTIAIKNGHLQVVKLLMETNPVCNSNSIMGSIWKPMTPMTWKRKLHQPLDIAAQNGSVEMAEFLLTKGVKLNADDSQNPLYQAVCCGRVDMAKLFIKHGAKIKPRVVHAARLKKQATMMKLLVDNMKEDDKAELNSYDEDKLLEDEQSKMKSFFAAKDPVPLQSKTKKWFIIITLFVIVIAVALGASTVLNYLIDVKWT
ncbi:uncharacterized protein LOC135130538 isoform X1 [Zophobas morio]|uniref:uncharacterized protein LOC135130538 isoform X1 n=1 Tax=Zophobas morio TaxID=2755281 RepID=UPI00308325E3